MNIVVAGAAILFAAGLAIGAVLTKIALKEVRRSKNQPVQLPLPQTKKDEDTERKLQHA